MIIFQVFFLKRTPLWFQQQTAATTLKCVQALGDSPTVLQRAGSVVTNVRR